MKRTNFYTPARRVWFQKNDDSKTQTYPIDEEDKKWIDESRNYVEEQRMKRVKRRLEKRGY